MHGRLREEMRQRLPDWRREPTLARSPMRMVVLQHNLSQSHSRQPFPVPLRRQIPLAPTARQLPLRREERRVILIRGRLRGEMRQRLPDWPLAITPVLSLMPMVVLQHNPYLSFRDLR